MTTGVWKDVMRKGSYRLHEHAARKCGRSGVALHMSNDAVPSI
jgi:hypothetical protein